MIARPAAKFVLPRVHVSLRDKPYEHRCVLIVSSNQATTINPRMGAPEGEGLTYFTRGKVVDAVARGEMRWVDRFHNIAASTEVASGTWQKTRSGPVACMQLKVGAKGRYVPATQRDPELRSGEVRQFRQVSPPSGRVPCE